ncbi:MAG: transglycosylase SLT domain-containing protein [Gemmatimonadetes bacterium]|nr:transglycosylase SLT domain-containing protein [Gemmatimonadota bacterium]
MASRYWVVLALFLGALVVIFTLRPAAAPAGRGGIPDDVPAEALSAFREGRYLRASRILRQYLARTPDPAPAVVLLAAQAEAGWGDWERVRELLEGRPWLDTLKGGLGRSLLARSRLALGEWDEGRQDLERYLAIAPEAGDRERGIAEVRRGRALQKAGSFRAAVVAYDSAARLLPQVGDWIQLLAVGAAAEAGDTAQVRARLAGLDARLAGENGWRARVTAMRRVGDTVGASAVAAAAARALASAGARAEAWDSAATIQLAAGDTLAAIASLRHALDASRGSSAALAAARTLASLPGRSAPDRLAIGRVLVWHGDVTGGVASLRAYLAAPGVPAAARPRIRLEIANALFGAGRYPDAEREYLAVAADPAASGLGGVALYGAGRAQYRAGREADARATLLRVAELFPRDDAAASALFLLGDLDQDDGRYEDARRLFRQVVNDHGDVDEVGKAYMRLGGLAYVAGDYQGAADIYEEYRRRFPGGERFEQATYWASRSYRALGRPDLADARLREIRRLGTLTYYSVRAGDLLHEDIWSTPLGPDPVTPDDVRADVARGIERVDLLRDLELDAGVAYEIARLQRYFDGRPEALYALAEALDERGFTAAGIRLGRELYDPKTGWNARLLRILYPFPYRDVISAEARERGLDPFLVAALIRQESAFRADARSSAGAIGLMQVMPATGRRLARAAGLHGFTPAMLRQPEVNIHLGTTFVADLLREYRVPQMLAAYNAGPARVERWRQFPEARDPELFAERIPFDETRGYVKIVQTNARIYRALYAESPADATGR